MATFIGSLIIVTLCCLAMGLGLLLKGKPLCGGCGEKSADKLRCISCPNRRKGVRHDEATDEEPR